MTPFRQARIAGIKTTMIYRGVIPFIVIQLIALAVIFIFGTGVAELEPRRSIWIRSRDQWDSYDTGGGSAVRRGLAAARWDSPCRSLPFQSGRLTACGASGGERRAGRAGSGTRC